MRVLLLLSAMVVTGCVSLSPEGARVFVYRAPLDVSGEDHAMPGGCERLSATPQTVMTEEEMEGTDDPYRVERNEAGAAGANALLVLSQQVIPRRDTECSTASPITDCPGSSGAWFHVEFESYSCTPDAMQALDHVPHSSAATHAGAVGR